MTDAQQTFFAINFSRRFSRKVNKFLEHTNLEKSRISSFEQIPRRIKGMVCNFEAHTINDDGEIDLQTLAGS